MDKMYNVVRTSETCWHIFKCDASGKPTEDAIEFVDFSEYGVAHRTAGFELDGYKPFRKYKTYKQLVNQLSEVKEWWQMEEFMADVDMSYQHEKITYADNETFYRIINNYSSLMNK